MRAPASRRDTFRIMWPRTQALLAHAPPEVARAMGASAAELETRLVALLREARKAWPGVVIDDDAFIAHLGAQLAPGAAPLDAIHTSDLFLAFASAVGDAAAIAHLQRNH